MNPANFIYFFKIFFELQHKTYSPVRIRYFCLDEIADLFHHPVELQNLFLVIILLYYSLIIESTKEAKLPNLKIHFI